MLSSGIMQRAFVEVIVLGLACGPLGVWVLLLRRSYAAESLSHAMLPGLGARRAGRASRWCSARPPACSSPRSGSRSSAGTSASPSSSPACSGSAASSRSAPRRRRGCRSCCSATCSGSPTPTSSPPALLCAGVLLALAFAYRPLSLAGFEHRGGRADLLLLAILGVTTVAAVQGLGNLLLVALILAPAAAALNLASRLPYVLALAAALAVLAGIAGPGRLLRAGDRHRRLNRALRHRNVGRRSLETQS